MRPPMLATSSTTPPSTSVPSFLLERKLKKPLMEKRRRARINECLEQLKQLLMNAMPHQRSKLEKVDILEMTVAYLKKTYDFDQSNTTEVQRQTFLDGFSVAALACIEFLQNTVVGNGALQAALFQHLQIMISAEMTKFGLDHPSLTSLTGHLGQENRKLNSMSSKKSYFQANTTDAYFNSNLLCIYKSPIKKVRLAGTDSNECISLSSMIPLPRSSAPQLSPFSFSGSDFPLQIQNCQTYPIGNLDRKVWRPF